jgi:uncharacterized heparinase superfamily protein
MTTQQCFTVKQPSVGQKLRWVRSISPANIRNLAAAGVGSLGDLAALEGRQLAAVAMATEIDIERLMSWVDHARDLLADCELMRGEMLPVEAESGDGDEGRGL